MSSWPALRAGLASDCWARSCAALLCVRRRVACRSPLRASPPASSSCLQASSGQGQGLGGQQRRPLDHEHHSSSAAGASCGRLAALQLVQPLRPPQSWRPLLLLGCCKACKPPPGRRAGRRARVAEVSLEDLGRHALQGTLTRTRARVLPGAQGCTMRLEAPSPVIGLGPEGLKPGRPCLAEVRAWQKTSRKNCALMRCRAPWSIKALKSSP